MFWSYRRVIEQFLYGFDVTTRVTSEVVKSNGAVIKLLCDGIITLFAVHVSVFFLRVRTNISIIKDTKYFNVNLIFAFFFFQRVPHTLKNIFIRGYEIKNHVKAPLQAKSTSETIKEVIFSVNNLKMDFSQT